MQDTHGFSLSTAKHAEQWRPERRFSDKFTDEDIDRMLRNASIKVGKFVMPEEGAERKDS